MCPDPLAIGMPAWTFPVARAEDELLSSWLSRSAHSHGVAAYAFLSLRLPVAPVWNRDVDLTAPQSLLARIDQVAALPAGSAEAASLVPLLPDLVAGWEEGGATTGGHVPLLLSAGVYHRKRRLHGVQYCPACVAGPEPSFRRSGRLAFVVACPAHGVPLRDGCPFCDEPVAPHRALVGRFGRCHVCDGSLGASDARPGAALPEGASSMQARCVAALAAGPSPAPGLPCAGRDYLALVRTLVAVLVAGRRHAHEARPKDPTAVGPHRRRHFERMRVGERASMLAELSQWTDDWPSRFADLAGDLGLTRRSFVRLALPPVLAHEVSRLPEGRRRRRVGWRSILDDAPMRRLRRDDPSGYRSARARRLLAATSPAAA